MQPLTERNLAALVEHLQDSSLDPPIRPIIVEYPSSAIVFDGSFLLEWTIDEVDRKNKLYRGLTVKRHDNEIVQRLIRADHWTTCYARNQKFHPVEEAEPGACTQLNDCVAYKCRTTYRHYRTEYLAIIEAFMNELKVSDIFQPSDYKSKLTYRCHQPVGYTTELVLLCAFEGRNVVGAVANSIPE